MRTVEHQPIEDAGEQFLEHLGTPGQQAMEMPALRYTPTSGRGVGQRFDPDRFLPERSKGRSRWQYLPFGGGPRSCIGDHFAMLEATLALATIIRTAEIDSLDDDFPLATPFTVVAAEPVHAHIYLRAKAATYA
jgi:Cytochrome P450